MKLFTQWKAAFLLLAATVIPAIGSAQYGNTVRENVYWDYKYQSFNYAILDSEELLQGFHFKGTENVDGTEYAVFRGPDGDKIALMREQDSRVYLHLEGLECHDYYNSEILHGEVLLYDFSLKQNEIFRCVGFDSVGLYHSSVVECRITDARDIMLAGHNFWSQEFRLADGTHPDDLFAAIEGVGNLRGLLPFPQFANYTSGSGDKLYYVQSVRDADGHVIFELPTNSVGELGEDATSAEPEYFTLDGKRIEAPAEGDIVIRRLNGVAEKIRF